MTSDLRERAIWMATAKLNEAMMKRALKNAGEAETAPTTQELVRECIEAYEQVMRSVDDVTDYRCGGVEGHIFGVPWGDEAPRSTVVCPVCGATAFIHRPVEES